VLVYVDTVFNTFMFAFPPAGMAATVSGMLMGADGAPAAHAPITLTAGRVVYRSFTDAKGGYRFYGAPKGEVALASTTDSGSGGGRAGGLGGGHGIVINRGGGVGVLENEQKTKPVEPA
jgi:hypothetical protein